MMRDVVARTADGKLFHARGATTGNAWSPKVDSRVGRTIRVVVANEHRWRWPSMLASQRMLSVR